MQLVGPVLCRCCRCLLPPSPDIPKDLKAQGWSSARAFAATQLRKNPNAFFYRHTAPHLEQAQVGLTWIAGLAMELCCVVGDWLYLCRWKGLRMLVAPAYAIGPPLPPVHVVYLQRTMLG